MEFTKMHGLGNDFIVIDDMTETIKEELAPELARAACRRHFGVGGDGLVIIRKSAPADVRMRIFNSDGSEAEMCGNAIRCVARYMVETKGYSRDEVTVETLNGSVKRVKVIREGDRTEYQVDMGEPVLTAGLIPVSLEDSPVVGRPIQVDNRKFQFTAVSMGNPHCVIFVDEIKEKELLAAGELLEKHPLFPRKTNVEFVKVLNKEKIQVLVYERGVGPTLACGTGACAAVVAAVLNGLTGRTVTVTLPGGDLYIWWAGNNHVFMTGPAEKVFSGSFDPGWLAGAVDV
ncbi:MAG TPA: diaminopimelate epimerase [Firmicutes bacterium]|nr:diaminopimelate epimerase [Bacillota bacterium]